MSGAASPGPLPIHEAETRLLDGLRRTGRVLLSAPTGSGKSTQVPQMLLRAGLLGDGQLIVLQPRRLATRLLARRVADELGVPLGREVGYQIRFDNVSSEVTRIKFVTEGILLRQLQDNPRLEGVTAVVFDEFHERHLYSDLSLARALEVQERDRPDLRLVVMSATLDLRQLEPALRPCEIVETGGRTYPVDIDYADRPSYSDPRPVWEQAADALADEVRRGAEGDALVFMPGAFEIQRTLEALRERRELRGWTLLPLHGELSPRDQDAAVSRQEGRKAVVATNVAETSLTIDGVRIVIDSGLARIPRHDPGRGINTLVIEKISRAAADQRAGRSGRTAPGRCRRLWTQDEHAHRPAQELPEVKRLDLAEVALGLKAAGVENLRQFRWIEAPPEAAVAHAEELLADLGAVEPVGAETEGGLRASRITALGRRMLAFPVHPRYARLLLAAQEFGCVYHAALLAALSQGRELLLRKVDRDTVKFREDRLGDRGTSDFFQWIRAWEYAAAQEFRLEACQRAGIHAVTARQSAQIFRAFLDLASRQGLDVGSRDLDEEALRRCVLLAFSDHVARRVDEGTLRCELVHGRRGSLARESIVQTYPLIVAAEVRELGGRDGDANVVLSMVTAIEAEWLEEFFPGDFGHRTQVRYDAGARRVNAEQEITFRGLAVSSRRLDPPPLDEAARLLAAEVLAGRLPLPDWDHGVEQWILRLNCVSRWCPELALPPIGEEERRALVEQICHGAVSYKDLKERPVKSLVREWLSFEQARLVEAQAPERLDLPNGRKPKVTYVADGPPTIALRIQELYGVTSTPRVGLGRVPVTVQILAPSMRPVQVTQDLASFWSEHYPRLKSELQRKYPKHEWR